MTYMPMKPELRDDKQDKPDERRRRRIAGLLGGGAVSILALLVGVGAWSQSNRRAETLSVLAAQQDAVPLVRTMTAKAETEPRTIELPGSLAAFDSATLSARATGYISVRNADIGSKVRKGDVLAVIAAPDLDQQLAQADGAYHDGRHRVRSRLSEGEGPFGFTNARSWNPGLQARH